MYSYSMNVIDLSLRVHNRIADRQQQIKLNAERMADGQLRAHVVGRNHENDI